MLFQKKNLSTLSFLLFLGRCLLILDGATCHFDLAIAQEAERFNIELLCLPSNTTHELQPCDKSLFRPLEYAWDEEVDLFWEISDQNKLDKTDFCKIFKKAWARAATAKNMMSGFEACGIYPFNPSRIPDGAYAPSDVTHCEATCFKEGLSLNEDAFTLTNAKTSTPNSMKSPSACGIQALAVNGDSIQGEAETSGSSISTFRKFATPEIKKGQRKQTRKALNYKAVHIAKSLFVNETENECIERDETESDEQESEVEPEPEFCAAVKEDDYILAYIIFNFGTKKEMKKFYVGKVVKLKVGRKKNQIEAKFFRKIPSKDVNGTTVGFSEPPLKDVWKIDPDQIIQNLQQPASERRGRVFFEQSAIKYDGIIQ